MTNDEIMLGNAAFTSKLNVLHHAYVDICDDLIAGLLLSQILYWFGADRSGRPRARITKDGYLWIAKSRADWYDEIRISPKQYDRAVKILQRKGYVVLRTMKFNGSPTTHIRINSGALINAIDTWKLRQARLALGTGATGAETRAAVGFSPLGNNDIPGSVITSFPKGEYQDQPIGNFDSYQRDISITENTAKNTNEITTNNTHTTGALVSFDEVWRHYPKRVGNEKARAAYIQAINEGANQLEILVNVALYRQHILCLMDHGELEYRYVPTGGKWFSEKGWLDDIPSISSKLDYDTGREYNLRIVKLRSLVKGGSLDEIRALLTKLPY